MIVNSGMEREPSSKLELSFRCKYVIYIYETMNSISHINKRNLKDMDVLSKSDPMLVLYSLENSTWREVGRTEMIKYVNSP